MSCHQGKMQSFSLEAEHQCELENSGIEFCNIPSFERLRSADKAVGHSESNGFSKRHLLNMR